MSGSEQAEDTTSEVSRDLASTVEDLILQALASSNLAEHPEDRAREDIGSTNVSGSGDGSNTESQTGIELRELLGAVCVSTLFFNIAFISLARVVCS